MRAAAACRGRVRRQRGEERREGVLAEESADRAHACADRHAYKVCAVHPPVMVRVLLLLVLVVRVVLLV